MHIRLLTKVFSPARALTSERSPGARDQSSTPRRLKLRGHCTPPSCHSHIDMVAQQDHTSRRTNTTRQPSQEAENTTAAGETVRQITRSEKHWTAKTGLCSRGLCFREKVREEIPRMRPGPWVVACRWTDVLESLSQKILKLNKTYPNTCCFPDSPC